MLTKVKYLHIEEKLVQGNLFFKFGFRAAGGTYGVYKITDTAKKITFKLGSSFMKIKFVLFNLFFSPTVLFFVTS